MMAVLILQPAQGCNRAFFIIRRNDPGIIAADCFFLGLSILTKATAILLVPPVAIFLIQLSAFIHSLAK